MSSTVCKLGCACIAAAEAVAAVLGPSVDDNDVVVDVALPAAEFVVTELSDVLDSDNVFLSCHATFLDHNQSTNQSSNHIFKVARIVALEIFTSFGSQQYNCLLYTSPSPRD